MRDNQLLEWAGPAERSSCFENWSVPGRPFNVDPLLAHRNAAIARTH
jgi:hypothetical protein